MRLKHLFFTATVGAAIACLLLPAAQAQQTPLSATASASTQSGNSRTAAKAIDGDVATRWEASNSSPGSWLALNFSSPQYVERLRITEYGGHILGYEIQVFNGIDWTVWSTGTTVGPEIPVGVNQINSVRLYITKAYGQPSISEISAYATGVPGCPIYDGTASTVVQGELDCHGTTISAPTCRQLPLFRLAPEAHLKNIKIMYGQVLCEGNCSLENIEWQHQPCAYSAMPLATFAPGAATGSTIDVNGGYGVGIGIYAGPQPPFGITPGNTIRLRNFTFGGLTSLNTKPPTGGGSGTPPSWSTMNFDLDNVRFNQLAGPLVHGGNLRARNLSIVGFQPGMPVICAGYAITSYTGWRTPLGETWNTSSCDVSPSDITALPAP